MGKHAVSLAGVLQFLAWKSGWGSIRLRAEKCILALRVLQLLV
jgi:hypothetical protein